jgi:hypothetical protein
MEHECHRHITAACPHLTNMSQTYQQYAQGTLNNRRHRSKDHFHTRGPEAEPGSMLAPKKQREFVGDPLPPPSSSSTNVRVAWAALYCIIIAAACYERVAGVLQIRYECVADVSQAPPARKEATGGGALLWQVHLLGCQTRLHMKTTVPPPV